MRFFLLSSFILALFSCASSRVSEISPEDRKTITIFTDTTSAYLYKNKIDLYGHYLSGIMMIKPVGSSNYKVAITTEFGAKIMDFELTNGKFILHDCIAEMKRKRILSVVETDMKLLLGAPRQLFIQHTGDTTAYLREADQAIYTVNNSPKVVTRIENYKNGRKKVEIALSAHEGRTPGKITVTHTGIPMNIELNLIKAREDAS